MIEITAAEQVAIAREARVAMSVVTAQQYDYFVSSKDADKHAIFSDIDPATFIKVGNIGGKADDPDRYTSMPRSYPEGLEQFLRQAVTAANDGEVHPFLHSDRYTLTYGHTLPQASEERNFSLERPDVRSVAIRLGRAAYTQHRVVPDLNKVGMHQGDIQTGSVSLSLGSNIVTDDNPNRLSEAVRAVWNLQRPWESVLAIGKEAISDMREALEEFEDGDTDELATDLSRVPLLSAVRSRLAYLDVLGVERSNLT